MPQKLIDQTTIQPDGSPGDDAFTAFATCNDNFEDAEQRLSALEGGSSNIGQDVADLRTGLQQETLLRTDADTALSQAVAAEVTARQNADAALGARFIGKNRLINGSMRWWQRGTNFTAPGYSVDRWYFNAGGVATPSLSRNTVMPGAFDTECIYLAKIAYGAVTDAANHYVVLEQRMENVTTLAGRTVTVSLKVFNSGAAGRQIAIELGQSFGAGGSAQVSGIGAAKYSLAAGINTVTHTVNIPSISGKTVGANSSLILTLWATGGSNFNARNASLGAQTGDLHFTQVQLEEGASASAFEYRLDALELMLCQRFYEKSYDLGVLPGSVSVNGRLNRFYDKQGGGSTADVRFTVRKRATPAIAIYNDQTGQINSISAANGASGTVSSVINIGETGCQVNYAPASSWGAAFHYTADAEI
ncbi:hypothetical protein D7U89_10880 [Stenotrophomonas maltophilia]|uniref:hypothetical protein n=1 Tax=Stenotrophomonas TaxID=40323 RepID=UPI00131257F3|nr:MULTISPECIES: hypothetical protein [Stenotrophomonas]MBA0225985.1 hypothetical protein [Stenotrophomonas maltophilia]MBA0366891.1 hypothetical protein [Stenotrophomonas maltophilia]MBA0402681.1 hypothetical protein [Stenotrophomonas maltophilia]MDQ7271390.1 hypothetical protein [Stenotrophomonas sp. Sm3212]